ncbi:fatty acyl-CoA reductase 1 isoform X2 [Anabrus simplex]|uniref:fatty acyl-CoA reductase 1 isoform X2 n=1 Tax=Anabrus simplex TaxID=316456 RepID=UPI0035A38CF8
MESSTEKIDTTYPQSIPDFFSGRSVFITGATGFIGKVLIEKLLYACPQIDRIYVLVRPKKGQNIHERIKELADIPLFDRLRKEQPNALDKLHCIAGDVSKLDLGMSPADRQLLEDQISVIFHTAATVRFIDPLPKAILMNVRGTREVVRLALGMKHLKAFLHVSTTYCNTFQMRIEERLYDPPADWRAAIQMSESSDASVLEILSNKFLGCQPNTYTFTKALGEHVINDHRDQLPAVIFRPSIVVSTVAEPMPGWGDSYNGISGLMVAGAMGLIHVPYHDDLVRMDYIPVDVVCKGMIIASWLRGQQSSNGVPVYNCSSHEMLNVNMRMLETKGLKMLQERPMNDTIFYPWICSTNSFPLFFVGFILFQLIPALLFDTILTMTGRKKMLVKIQQRIFNAFVALHYFTNHEWQFINSNFRKLESAVLAKDYDAFNYQLSDVDEYYLYKMSAIGARRYLLKQPDETLPKAIQQYRRVLSIVLTIHDEAYSPTLSSCNSGSL